VDIIFCFGNDFAILLHVVGLLREVGEASAVA
jgi:hypothetical protein